MRICAWKHVTVLNAHSTFTYFYASHSNTTVTLCKSCRSSYHDNRRYICQTCNDRLVLGYEYDMYNGINVPYYINKRSKHMKDYLYRRSCLNAFIFFKHVSVRWTGLIIRTVSSLRCTYLLECNCLLDGSLCQDIISASGSSCSCIRIPSASATLLYQMHILRKRICIHTVCTRYIIYQIYQHVCFKANSFLHAFFICFDAMHLWACSCWPWCIHLLCLVCT
jgi:hypothetical protein